MFLYNYYLINHFYLSLSFILLFGIGCLYLLNDLIYDNELASGLLIMIPYFSLLYLLFYTSTFFLYFFIGIPLLNLFIFILIKSLISKKNQIPSPWKAVLNSNPISIIENVFEGILVTGAAGSGKTQSVIYPILKHYANYNFTGLIYDYKDFELTEIAYGLYHKNPNLSFKCICFHDLSISSRINPIAPRYITNEDTLRGFFQVIYENILGTTNERNPFFKNASISAASALAWKLYEEDPKNCTIPFIAGLFSTNSMENLASLISSNKRAKSLGSTFLSCLNSPETSGNVQASITNFLSFFLTPEKFYILGADEVSLTINHPETPTVLSIINNPSEKESYSPVLSAIVGATIKQMSYRNRLKSFVLLDEAPTLKLQNASQIPATLRSYNVSTLYCLQDKSLSDEVHGEVSTRAILSNLSNMYIGRSLDERSIKMYESFSSLIKEKQKSTSYSRSLLELKDKTRFSISQRERHAIRASEFLKFKPGEFYNFSYGNEKKVKFSYKEPLRIKPKENNPISKKEIEQNYLHLLKVCENYQKN